MAVLASKSSRSQWTPLFRKAAPFSRCPLKIRRRISGHDGPFTTLACCSAQAAALIFICRQRTTSPLCDSFPTWRLVQKYHNPEQPVSFAGRPVKHRLSLAQHLSLHPKMSFCRIFPLRARCSMLFSYTTIVIGSLLSCRQTKVAQKTLVVLQQSLPNCHLSRL